MKRLTGSSPRLFKSCTHLIAIVGLVVASASTLSAQDRLFALLPGGIAANEGQDHLIEIDTRPEFVGQIRRAIPVVTRYRPVFGWFGSELYSIGSGRYLVWLTDNGQVVNLFDTVASHLSLFPVLPDKSRIVAVDSQRARVFVDAPDGILILDGQLGTVRRIGVPDSLSSFSTAAHASSIERLFISRLIPGSTQFAVDVVDVTVGRVERTLTLGAEGIFGLAVDADGRRLFVAASQGLQVYDAQSGALLEQIPSFRGLGLNFRNALRIDTSRHRLLLTIAGPGSAQYGPEARVAAFDLDTLTLRGIAAGQDPFFNIGARLLTGPRSPMYVFNSFVGSGVTCDIGRLEVFDPSSGALRRRTDVLQLWGAYPGWPVCDALLALQSPPPAPMIQSQIVSGRRVTIAWAPSDDAVHYDIEAGSAPGLNDLAVSHGHTSTSFSVDGIPSGRYFVRVRAINWVGRSLPSNEVEIVVP